MEDREVNGELRGKGRERMRERKKGIGGEKKRKI